MLLVKVSCIGHHENATVHPVADDEGVPTLRQWVGQAVRQIREHNGQRQDDLARSARDYGMAWSVSKISALERGDKALPAEELLMLPLVLARAGCGSVTLIDLLPHGPDMVRLVDGIEMPGQVLVDSLEYGDGDDGAVLWRSRESSRELLAGWFSGPEGETAAIRAAWPQMPGDPHDVARAWHSTGEAERVAARRLDVPFPALLAAAMGTWDRSLTAERDQRVQERTDPDTDADARSLQALRGHITRDLYRELGPAIERYRGAVEQSEES